MSSLPAPRMRMRGSGVVLCVTLLAGCAAPPATLLDTNWRAVEIDGEPMAGGNGRQGLHIVLRRAGERVSGYAGCNSLTGGYRLDGGSLRFGPLAMTRMACVPEEANRLEAAFTKALGDTVSYRIEGGALELRDTAGMTRMRLRAGEAP